MTLTHAAVVAADGVFSHDQLTAAARRVASGLLIGGHDLCESRVAYLAPPSGAHVSVQLGIWAAGGTAVPLSFAHSESEHDYILRDAEASCVVVDPAHVDAVRRVSSAIGIRLLVTTDLLSSSTFADLPEVAPDRRAMIVYTSGTTGRPKGVVTTHANIAAQVNALLSAWGWTADDRILNVLPLHHVHGIINALHTPLRAGATCELLARFDPAQVWTRFASGEITVFTGVPTIYQRLIDCWRSAPPVQRRAWSDGAERLRLMMSGSAALPVRMMDEWREITGHTLLERYGMTETGMILSNPLDGERRPGSVGTPLPGVRVRLLDESGAAAGEGVPGEVQVAGESVFLKYWRRPAETVGAFVDGWFKTGDIAVFEGGAYRILGRSGTDIIKTGGYKVSALEIEEVLRMHPAIAECAIVGVPDRLWGERVSAVVELRGNAHLSLDELQQWARTRLASYKIPKTLNAVPALPRNALGKILKPAVVASLESPAAVGDPGVRPPAD